MRDAAIALMMLGWFSMSLAIAWYIKRRTEGK